MLKFLSENADESDSRFRLQIPLAIILKLSIYRYAKLKAVFWKPSAIFSGCRSIGLKIKRLYPCTSSKSTIQVVMHSFSIDHSQFWSQFQTFVNCPQLYRIASFHNLLNLRPFVSRMVLETFLVHVFVLSAKLFSSKPL